MATISEIARLANVSRGTVDRVLNNRGNVSKEKEEQVKKILKELNYSPNIFARSLKLSKEFTIGIIIPDTSDNVRFWKLPVIGINKGIDELSKFKLQAKYYLYDNFTEDSLNTQIDQVIKEKENLHGLIISPINTSTCTTKIKSIPDSLPYVFINNNVQNTNAISFIGTDSYRGGVLAASMFHKLIQKPATIAIIMEYEDLYPRAKGCIDYFAANENSIRISYHVADRKKDHSLLESTTKYILQSIDDLKGIFVTSAGVNRVAEIVAKSEKEYIHVIGYDITGENAQALREGKVDMLINQRPDEQGYRAVYMLYRHILLNEQIPKQQYLPMDIVVKENLEEYLQYISL